MPSVTTSEAIEQALHGMRTRIIPFSRFVMPGYMAAWFHHEIAGVLEAQWRGEIDRAMFFLPPRHGKSQLVDIHMPAMVLGNQPERQFILASYAASLARTMSYDLRSLIKSARYQHLFPGIQLARDRSAVDVWRLEGHRGGFKAVGVGGGVTGTGGDWIIIDDPVKGAQQANSEIVRESTLNWYRTDLRTRLHPGGVISLVQTRWHVADLAGALMEAANEKGAKPWHVVLLPAYDEEQGWLWPERYSEDEYEDLKRAAGKWGWPALFLQQPIPMGGGMLQRSWFNRIHISDVPKMRRVVMGVDLAITEKNILTKTDPDYTVGMPIGVDPEGRMFFFPPYREQAEWPDAKRGIIARAKAYKCGVIGIEKVQFQAAASQVLKREQALAGVSIKNIEADRDKIMRVTEWSPIAESRQIWLVEDGTGWVDRFLEEAENFPRGKHDDLIDAAGIAIHTIRWRAGDGKRQARGSTMDRFRAGRA